LKEYGLQFWTVHVECEKDFRGMIRKAADLGFTKVEFTDYYDLTAEELKKELDENGLKPVSRQMMIDAMEKDIDGAIAYAKTIGLQNIASCVADTSTKENLDALIGQLRPLVKSVSDAGLTFLYHNHGSEFVPLDGKLPIVSLLEAFEEYNFGLELDTYWALGAGADILDFMKEYAGKIKNIHIKGGDGKGHSCPFRESVIDVKAIVSLARELGITDILVEDDTPVPDGLTLATLNIETLKEWDV